MPGKIIPSERESSEKATHPILSFNTKYGKGGTPPLLPPPQLTYFGPIKSEGSNRSQFSQLVNV